MAGGFENYTWRRYNLSYRVLDGSSGQPQQQLMRRYLKLPATCCTAVKHPFTKFTSSKKMAAKNINDMPVDDFLHIFEFLNLHEAVTVYSKTCMYWKETIAMDILSPKIYRLAQRNPRFKGAIKHQGWTEDCNDPEVVLLLFATYDYYSSK